MLTMIFLGLKVQKIERLLRFGFFWPISYLDNALGRLMGLGGTYKNRRKNDNLQYQGLRDEMSRSKNVCYLINWKEIVLIEKYKGKNFYMWTDVEEENKTWNAMQLTTSVVLKNGHVNTTDQKTMSSANQKQSGGNISQVTGTWSNFVRRWKW